ncbi:MAG: putative ATP-dependent helicase DinG [Phycisphaerae bacterium]|nr:putative ATP-dependent helicase DinG [Phycisphaerae bacterium]
MLSVHDVLGQEGLIAKRLAGYEFRPQQVEMASAVTHAFSRPQHLVVEAGTGIGKTFAYLIPAILRVAQHPQQRMVISTQTIALQEQLLNKDIPFLNAVLPVEFTAVLMKGRGNYVGLRRLEQTIRKQIHLFPPGSGWEELERLQLWVNQTQDGSLSDLNPEPDLRVWERVKSEHGNCMGKRCRHYESCFYQKARRRANHAQILVVNHALLCSDLALRQQGANVIPDYNYLVIDEAHMLEQVAGDHLGVTLGERQVQFLLQSLYNSRTGRGLLAGWHCDTAHEQVLHCQQSATELFDTLDQWQQKSGRANGRWTEPPPVTNTLSSGLRDLQTALGQIRNQLTDEDDLFEITSVRDRCQYLADALDTLLTCGGDDQVYWMESEGRVRRNLVLHAHPLHVGPLLQQMLFEATPSVVLTSATLSISLDSEFHYLRERIGVNECECLRLDSPFDFRSQMELHVEAHLPPPNAPNFAAAAAKAIIHYTRRTAGRALVLFTSYQQMNEIAELVKPALAESRLNLLVQGRNMPRSQMLEQLRQQPQTVLFGADSFWQGVDVAGEALQNVMIVKLPFAAPDQPMIEARIEAIESNEGSAFSEYQLPEAILRFKQGVGRLIRTTTDQGLVVILDSRIVHKSYGKKFLDALPPCNPIIHQRQPEMAE